MGSFLTAVLGPIQKRLDENHEAEEGRKKELRAFYFRALGDPNTTQAGREEAQNQLNKLLNPESKKGLTKIAPFFHKLAPPQGQQSPAQQPPSAQGGAAGAGTSGTAPAARGALQPPGAGIYSNYGSETAAAEAKAKEEIEDREYDKWLKRGKEIGLKDRDLAEFAGSRGQRLPTAQQSKIVRGTVREGEENKGKSFTQIVHPDGSVDYIEEAKKATKPVAKWGKLPGSDTAVLGWIVPGSNEGYKDEFGNDLPDFKPGATPTNERLYGAIQGYYKHFKDLGMPDEEARNKAGTMFVEREGIHLGRVQQQAAIDTALSGVGLGPGFSTASKTPPAAAGVAGAPPASKPTAAPKPSAAPGASAAPKALSPSISAYLGSVSGTLKGGGKAMSVRNLEGRSELAKLMGVDPVQLDTALSENTALRKQLGETIQRQYAIDRLVNTLDLHGDNFLKAAQTIKQTGSPLLNKPMRQWSRLIAGSPELAKYNVFANAVQREYGYLTAGGAQSRAMLPVSTSEAMEGLFKPDATLEEAVASVEATRKEATTERQAMEKTKDDIRQSISGGAVGQAVRQPVNGVNRPGSSGPTAGTVVGGYKFKGGDPNDRKNWEKQ